MQKKWKEHAADRRRPNSSIQRSAAEQRARANQKLAAIGEMTGGIAHDFRNFLAVIESGLRLVERNAEDPQKVREFIALARGGIDRGVELTGQLLAFARHQELDPHLGDLNEFLQEFEPFLRYAAGAEIRLVLSLTTGIPKCLVDPALFDAAVLNLVVNARDAMPNGGLVEIVTERLVLANEASGSSPLRSYVRVRVKDQGAGMTPEVVGRVLDPFFSTKGETGTGIGLPQVRTFMEMVGGHVEISSEPGGGHGVRSPLSCTRWV